MARLPARFKNLALTLVIIPFWTNLLIRTYAWQILLSPESLLSRALQAVGIGEVGEPLYPSAWAVLLGMVCDFLPFMVMPENVTRSMTPPSTISSAMPARRVS